MRSGGRKHRVRRCEGLSGSCTGMRCGKREKKDIILGILPWIQVDGQRIQQHWRT